uniref:Uncharacterized protein n=1 Tax=Timema tahoe TaxID=61484 RepID=A0A7R9IRY5_9NEOP|nr:unnamed protein product [Timema tahoe]
MEVERGNIGPVYHATYKMQRGRGLGSFLGGLSRFVKVLFVRGQKRWENRRYKQLEFVCPGDGDYFRDLSSIKLYLRIQLVKGDGTPVEADNKIRCVNNLIHSLFSQITISLNETPITTSIDNYAYRDYLETLTNYGRDASDTHLVNGMWFLDTPAANGELAASTENKGFATRLYLLKHPVDLLGRLHADIFNISQLLLKNVSMCVKLIRNKQEFYLLTDADNLNTNVRLKILEATLFVKHVEVSPTISIAIEKTLLRKPTDINRMDVKSVSLNNVVLGVIPKIVLFTMVSNDAFVGSLNTNLFQLIHRNLDRFVLCVSGIQKHLPILINFDNVGTSTLAYETLFSRLGIHHQNNGYLITREMFNKGYFMLAFDLTPDTAGQDSHTSLQTEGNVRFELQFKTDLDTAITCLFYSEYEGTVSIDSNREVVLYFYKCEEYLDTYARRPSLAMTGLMNKHSRRWTYNRKRLQAIASEVCDHYCCMYAVAKAAGWSLTRFTDLFSTTNLCKNDPLAVTLFKRHFGSCPRCTRRGAQTCVPVLDIKVQTQTAIEKVTCSCNVVEDHLPFEDSQPSLVTRTFYLNDKQNTHVSVGLFPSHNFFAHVMYLSNSRRLILTVPQWNFFVKELPFWSDCVENCVNFESNMDDFNIVVHRLIQSLISALFGQLKKKQYMDQSNEKAQPNPSTCLPVSCKAPMTCLAFMLYGYRGFSYKKITEEKKPKKIGITFNKQQRIAEKNYLLLATSASSRDRVGSLPLSNCVLRPGSPTFMYPLEAKGNKHGRSGRTRRGARERDPGRSPFLYYKTGLHT